MFAQAFTFLEILTFEIFDLEEVGQDHGVQHSQWRHLMEKSKSINAIFTIFVFLSRYDLCVGK